MLKHDKNLKKAFGRNIVMSKIYIHVTCIYVFINIVPEDLYKLTYMIEMLP